MLSKTKKLIALAKLYMNQSVDPVHDIEHVERVAAYASRISKGYNLSKKEYEALMLAVWWHDVSRALLPNTSFIFMFFIDDLLSSILLWFWTIRYGLFSSVAGIAIKIIFCKSRTTGTFFVRLFLSKRSRLLMQILQDADALDMLHTERATVLCSISSYSKVSTFSYKVVAYWWTSKDRLKLQTTEAKELLRELLAQFIEWLQSAPVTEFHHNLFGERVSQKLLKRWLALEALLLQTT